MKKLSARWLLRDALELILKKLLGYFSTEIYKFIQLSTEGFLARRIPREFHPSLFNVSELFMKRGFIITNVRQFRQWFAACGSAPKIEIAGKAVATKP